MHSLHCTMHCYDIHPLCQVWCLKEGINQGFGTHKNDFGETLLDRIASLKGAEARKVQDIIFKASRKIGDSDCALGVGRMMVEDPISRICQLSLEGRSDSALQLYDPLVLSNPGDSSLSLMRATYCTVFRREERIGGQPG